MAVAAIVASLTVVRQRQDDRKPGDDRQPASPSSTSVDLDQLRAAGL